MPLLYEQVTERIVQDIRQGVHPPGSQLPTEQEYVRRLGVSRITVKRAMTTLERQGLIRRFRGKGTFVADDALRTLGPLERPGSVAPAQPRPRRRRIGFMLPEMSDLFGVQMVNGIDDRCRELDVDLSIRRTHGDVAIEAETIQKWIDDGLDGMIVFPCHGEFYNETLLRAVLNKFPVVLVDRTLGGIPVPSVMTDNQAAARAITDWLLGRGHTSLGFVSPPVQGTSSLEDRLQGFAERVQANPGTMPVRMARLQLSSVLPGHNEAGAIDRDRDRIAEFLRERGDITAILASEFLLAVLIESAIAADEDLRARGIEIACFDSFAPAMTLHRYPHIKQDEVAMGRKAVDLILAQLDGEAPLGTHFVDFALALET